jgi:hypothetical protein
LRRGKSVTAALRVMILVPRTHVVKEQMEIEVVHLQQVASAGRGPGLK